MKKMIPSFIITIILFLVNVFFNIPPWLFLVPVLVHIIFLIDLWLGWLTLVCIWNFGWPSVPPIADVLVAVVLSLGVITIKNKNK